MKIRTLFKAPFLVNSGYGVHSRQILLSLLKDPMFDVYLEGTTWGNCSFVSEDNDEIRSIKKLIQKRQLAAQQKQEDWDLFLHCTIPNEWERKAKFNIGITAGIETNLVSHVWIQKANEMDLIIVPSEHSKKVFVDTVIQFVNKDINQQGQLKLEKPIEVCHEGVNTNIFKKLSNEEFNNIKTISSLDFESDFNFLCVGLWGNGGYKEDRKNIPLTIRYFIEAFLGRKDVGLVLKIGKGRNSISDYEVCLKSLTQIKSNFKQEDVPPIYLLHANLTDREMGALYNHPKIKTLVSFTHGEGFGLPLLEAVACNLPIIATNWSGHLDFLSKGKFSAVIYDMVKIPQAAVWNDILIKESAWAEVNEEDAKHRLRKMFNFYSKPTEWANELSKEIKQKFNLDVTGTRFVDMIKKHLISKVGNIIDPVENMKLYIDNEDDYNVLYTMPMSTGDVFISTAVVNGLKKQLPENSKIYFATDTKYASVLLGNKDIHKVIPYDQSMMNVDLCEQVFDLVFNPNIETHFMFSNWVRKGQGRLLAEQYAVHCQCELGEYFIQKDDSILDFINSTLKIYMTFHPGSGKEQWEARKYIDWQEVINNLKLLYPDLKIVQVGSVDEESFKGVDLDLRGKTSYQQLASILSNSKLHLSIDTFTMHLAASFDIPLVAVFGSSHAKSTGPWCKNKEKSKFILLEAEHRMGICDKACYKYQCKNNKQGCINEIDSSEIVKSCAQFLDVRAGGLFQQDESFKFSRIYSSISGYTTVYNCEKLNIPYMESIKSMLGFCSEVVVLDGCSDDGTYEKIQALAEVDNRIKLYQNEFDWTEPGVDGIQKAFARALCEGDFCWQQDADEIVHERDYEKIKMITKRFPNEADILHLPIVELWGDEQHFTGRNHSWKWRLSRNKPEITHSINKHARKTDEKTGKVYAQKGMSDGCEYTNVMTNDMLNHVGFYDQKLENIRIHNPLQYGEVMNEIFQTIPSVFHSSWMNLPNKIKQLRDGGTWEKLWSLLYQESCQGRFAEVDTDDKVKELSIKLKDNGGEDSDNIKYVCELKFDIPQLLKEWIEKSKK